MQLSKFRQYFNYSDALVFPMAKVKLNVNFTFRYSENFPFVCKVLMSAVLLEGEKSKSFNIGQGVAQGCSILPSSLFIFINQLLNEVEKAGIGI